MILWEIIIPGAEGNNSVVIGAMDDDRLRNRCYLGAGLFQGTAGAYGRDGSYQIRCIASMVTIHNLFDFMFFNLGYSVNLK